MGCDDGVGGAVTGLGGRVKRSVALAHAELQGAGGRGCQAGVEGRVNEQRLEEGRVHDRADGLAGRGHTHEQVAHERGGGWVQVVAEEGWVSLPGQGQQPASAAAAHRARMKRSCQSAPPQQQRGVNASRLEAFGMTLSQCHHFVET